MQSKPIGPAIEYRDSSLHPLSNRNSAISFELRNVFNELVAGNPTSPTNELFNFSPIRPVLESVEYLIRTTFLESSGTSILYFTTEEESFNTTILPSEAF